MIDVFSTLKGGRICTASIGGDYPLLSLAISFEHSIVWSTYCVSSFAIALLACAFIRIQNLILQIHTLYSTRLDSSPAGLAVELIGSQAGDGMETRDGLTTALFDWQIVDFIHLEYWHPQVHHICNTHALYYSLISIDGVLHPPAYRHLAAWYTPRIGMDV